MSNRYPPITCLCPTYGRFERLRDAVACFLLQDYPGKKKLLVLNDAPTPIILSERLSITADQYLVAAHVGVINARERFASLGHKRQALLTAAAAHGGLVAHWDDDDIYLPWHLTRCVEALLSNPTATCAKPRSAWWGVGPWESFGLCGPCHNVFEGQMVFRRERALELGGYPPKVSGQAKALLDAFLRAGELYDWNPAPEDISYVYRWSDGVRHISGGGDTPASHKAFEAGNRDFGDGRPLIPTEGMGIEVPGGYPEMIRWARARLVPQFHQIVAELRRRSVPSGSLDPEQAPVAGVVAERVKTRLAAAMHGECRYAENL